MGQALLLVALITALVRGVVHVRGWLLRRRIRAAAEGIERIAEGVSLRVLVEGTAVLPGLRARGANRTRGDLVLCADRFLVVSNRGCVLDLRRGSGSGLTSARCTGPGRLVLEGRVPSPSGRPGLYRVEAPVDDAEGWAVALRPFTRVS